MGDDGDDESVDLEVNQVNHEKMIPLDKSRIPESKQNDPRLLEAEADVAERLQDEHFRLRVCLREAAHAIYAERAGAICVLLYGPQIYDSADIKWAGIQAYFIGRIQANSMARWYAAGGVAQRVLTGAIDRPSNGQDFQAFSGEFKHLFPVSGTDAPIRHRRAGRDVEKDAEIRELWEHARRDVEKDLRDPAFRMELWDRAREFDAAFREIILCEHGRSKRFCPECSSLHGLRSVPPEAHPVEHLSAKDQTQLTYGPWSGPVYDDPGARDKARRMLLRIPALAGFDGCLDEIESRVWSMSFDGKHTQAEIAAAVSRAQSTVSTIRDRCVRKLNGCYLRLRAEDALPIEVLAWLRENGMDGDPSESDFINAVEALRRRDRAIRRGDIEHATTGCDDMDKLTILNC